MSGMRSALSAFVLGSGLACADPSVVFELPDSQYRPLGGASGGRVLAGRYVYESTLWTDGVIAGQQTRQEIVLGPVTFRGVEAWEARTVRMSLSGDRRFAPIRSDRVWFDRATLALLRYDALSADGSRGIEVDVTADSVIQRWGVPGQWMRDAKPRPRGLETGFAFAHRMAVMAALPLADRWAARMGDDRVAVVGRQEITVSAGTFLCWRIESAGTGWAQWRAWVAVDRPLLVKVESGPIRDRIEVGLASFEPGG